MSGIQEQGSTASFSKSAPPDSHMYGLSAIRPQPLVQPSRPGVPGAWAAAEAGGHLSLTQAEHVLAFAAAFAVQHAGQTAEPGSAGSPQYLLPDASVRGEHGLDAGASARRCGRSRSRNVCDGGDGRLTGHMPTHGPHSGLPSLPRLIELFARRLSAWRTARVIAHGGENLSAFQVNV